MWNRTERRPSLLLWTIEQSLTLGRAGAAKDAAATRGRLSCRTAAAPAQVRRQKLSVAAACRAVITGRQRGSFLRAVCVTGCQCLCCCGGAVADAARDESLKCFRKAAALWRRRSHTCRRSFPLLRPRCLLISHTSCRKPPVPIMISNSVLQAMNLAISPLSLESADINCRTLRCFCKALNR